MTERQAEYEARRTLEATRKRARKNRRRGANNKTIAKVRVLACRLCLRDAPSEAHHIVPRSKFHREGTDVINHASNLMPLCHRCHQDHHTTHHRVPRHLLSDDEYAFVVEHTSEAWAEAWYPVR